MGNEGKNNNITCKKEVNVQKFNLHIVNSLNTDCIYVEH